MRRLVTSALVALSLGGAVAMAAPAQAAHFDGRCDIGEICLYEHHNSGGAVADFASDVHDYTIWVFYGTRTNLNDNVSSAWNNTNFGVVYLYEHTHQNGRTIASIGAQTSRNVEDNVASSHD